MPLPASFILHVQVGMGSKAAVCAGFCDRLLADCNDSFFHLAEVGGAGLVGRAESDVQLQSEI